MANEAGLNFQYDNDHEEGTDGNFLHEITGGGVAVLDYDGDGWPDLYFTQGCPFPDRKTRHDKRNRLFRNLGNGQFQDVTAQAGVGDQEFGQGVAAGDYDNDGWEDWDGISYTFPNWREEVANTNPWNPDTDGDSMTDGYEADNG